MTVCGFYLEKWALVFLGVFFENGENVPVGTKDGVEKNRVVEVFYPYKHKHLCLCKLDKKILAAGKEAKPLTFAKWELIHFVNVLFCTASCSSVNQSPEHSH